MRLNRTIRRNKKISISLMICGICMILGAIGILVYTEIQEQYAQSFSQNIVSLIGEQLPVMNEFATEEEEMNETIEIDGESYIGILLIPQLELELPVANTCNMTILKQSPCVYTGSLSEKNCMIAAHNYEAHFKNIGNLMIGDEISILDAQGQVHGFQVIAEEIIQENNVDALYEGEWDLTLFTCMYGDNTNRIVLRFEEIVAE